MAHDQAKRTRRSPEDRLALAEAKAGAAETRAREARARAETAKRRVTKLKARMGAAEAKTATRRKIVLGTMLLWARGTEGNEWANVVLDALLWDLPDKDRALVEDLDAAPDYRRDTRRKAILGGALIAGARQAGPVGEGFAAAIPMLIGKLDRPHDIALFEGWSVAA